MLVRRECVSDWSVWVASWPSNFGSACRLRVSSGLKDALLREVREGSVWAAVHCGQGVEGRELAAVGRARAGAARDQLRLSFPHLRPSTPQDHIKVRIRPASAQSSRQHKAHTMSVALLQQHPNRRFSSSIASPTQG